jgi:hypothetical protein
MLRTLEQQIASLPDTNDIPTLAAYWSLYSSYACLKSVVHQLDIASNNKSGDMAERARKSIVVIGGLKESSAIRPSDRVAHDRNATCELFDSAQIEVGFLSTLRLGKPNNDRPRLMKVFLSDEETAAKVLTRLSAFKRSEKSCKLTFRTSLTKEERDERRKINMECQVQRETARKEGKDDDYIVYAGQLVLRKDVHLVKSKLPPLTGANLVPLPPKTFNYNFSDPDTMKLLQPPWLAAAKAASNPQTPTGQPPKSSSLSN